jgi:Helix-turn-helix domain
MFVVHLMQHKWGTEAPYPGYKTLAKRMAVSDKTGRRLAKSLEDKKYLVREIREAQTNKFHVKKLIDALLALKKTLPKKKTRPDHKNSIL